MRWFCPLILCVLVALSRFAFSQTPGPTPKAADDAARSYLPSQGLDFATEPPLQTSMLGQVQVHVLDLPGSGISPVPEPSSMAFFGLLATPFLFRRRRLHLH